MPGNPLLSRQHHSTEITLKQDEVLGKVLEFCRTKPLGTLFCFESTVVVYNVAGVPEVFSNDITYKLRSCIKLHFTFDCN